MSDLYDIMLYATGTLGALTTALLLRGGHGTALAVSVGANVSLFVWAYALHEGWHNLDEDPDEVLT